MGLARLPVPGADCATIHGNPTFNSQASFDFDASGTYTVSGDIHFSLEVTYDDACAMTTFMKNASDTCDFLNAASAAAPQAGFSADCTAKSGACDCQFSATVPQDTSGNYVVDGNSITLTPVAGSNGTTTTTPLDGTSEFCVDASTVTVKASDGTMSTLTK